MIEDMATATADDDEIIPLFDFTPTPEQAIALEQLDEFIASPQATMISLTGAAGCGKTALLSHVAIRIPGKVAWAGMTGKAAQRMHEAAGVYARTLHSTLYAPPNVDYSKPDFEETVSSPAPYVVIDECSMMTPQILEDLKDWTDTGTKVILVGDAFQLPPILSEKDVAKWGQDFSAFDRVHGPALTTVMRSTGDILQVSAELRRTHVMSRVSRGAYTYRQAPNPIVAAVADYLEDPEDHALITWTNAARMEANKLIRRHYGYQTFLAKGEPVLIRRNGQGLLNGDVLTVKDARPWGKCGPVQTLALDFEGVDPTIIVTAQGAQEPMDGGAPRIPFRQDYFKYRDELRKQKLPEPLPITYGYCLTAHLAQGSQYRRVTLFLRRAELASWPMLRSTILPGGQKVPFGVRFLYTAATRAKQQLTIVTD